jgi:hypothetical protein
MSAQVTEWRPVSRAERLHWIANPEAAIEEIARLRQVEAVLAATPAEQALPERAGDTLTPEQRAAVDEFVREMQEVVIPEIVETIHRRHAAVWAKHDQIVGALADTVAKATDYGVQDGEFVAAYILPTGPIHRAIPLLSELGIDVRPGFDGRRAAAPVLAPPREEPSAWARMDDDETHSVAIAVDGRVLTMPAREWHDRVLAQTEADVFDAAPASAQGETMDDAHLDAVCLIYHGEYAWNRSRGGQRETWRAWERKRICEALVVSKLVVTPTPAPAMRDEAWAIYRDGHFWSADSSREVAEEVAAETSELNPEMGSFTVERVFVIRARPLNPVHAHPQPEA